MIEGVTFPFTSTVPQLGDASSFAFLPIRLSSEGHSANVSGLLDTGATVNVLPFDLGLQLGLVWEQQTTMVRLTGNLAQFPARVIMLSAYVASFSPVRLAFAWTQSNTTPLILGQINFFMEFDVCFFRSDRRFEIKARNR
jgi:hypothetical protein